MIIDVHCHAGTGDGFRGPWDTAAELDDYLERAGRAGINRTCVFPVFNSDYPAANRRLVDIVADYSPLLWGFAAVNPQREKGRVHSQIARAVEDYGFIGIKVHGAEASPSRELCEVAARYGLPILFDIYRRPERIEMLARAFPEVSFIVPHLGGFADDWMVFMTVIGQLTRFPNVYADTSGVRYFDALIECVRAAPHKLLFGTDGPQLHPGVEITKVDELPLTTEQRSAVLGGTALSILPLAASPPVPTRLVDARPAPVRR